MEDASAMDWLRAAEIDAKSANALLREGLYSAAVFHTQQAYEKTYKAYLTFLRPWPELMKKIGHLTINRKSFEEANKGASEEEKQRLLRYGVSNFDDFDSLVSSTILMDKSHYENLLPLLNEFIKNDKTNEKMIIELRSKNAIRSKDGSKDLSSLAMTLYGIELINNLMSAHFEYVRYPDKRIKPWDYNSDVGIVQILPELISLVEYGIAKLKANI